MGVLSGSMAISQPLCLPAPWASSCRSRCWSHEDARMLIADFNIWHQGFDAGTVSIYLAGTNTLAPVYLDPACTVAAANPQTLTSEECNGEMGGKFSAPLYAAVAIECRYSSTDETGVQVP